MCTNFHHVVTTCFRLHSKLEALDFEVERAAEEELFQSQTGGSSVADGNGGDDDDEYD